MLSQETLYIVQECINEQKPIIAKQIEAENYYNNEVPNAMNHDFFGLMVDEKINYLLGKEPTIESENESYTAAILEILGKSYLYDLQYLAREASIKAIAWMQFYIDDMGKPKLMTIPSEEVIPVWTDKRHIELDMLIRRYPVTFYEGIMKKLVYKLEIYDKEHVYFYEEVDGVIRLDAEKYLNIDDDQEYGHLMVDGKPYNMGKVPFVWCKNNAAEKSDLIKVKDLIDKYNDNRQRQDAVLEDFKNFLINVKNYSGGDSNEASLKSMLQKRMIFTDGDGGVEILTPNIDTAANDSHNQTLKDDIILFGQSVDRNKMTTGNSASGVALKMLYAGLDLKCNGLESELNMMFDNLQYFIKDYLKLINVKVDDADDVNIIFNRDISINESESINMCKASVGVISTRTIVSNHPWVTDLEDELQALEDENKRELEDARHMLEGGDNHDEE